MPTTTKICPCCGKKCVYEWRTVWNCESHAWSTPTVYAKRCGAIAGMVTNEWLRVGGSVCYRQYFQTSTASCVHDGDCTSPGSAPSVPANLTTEEETICCECTGYSPIYNLTVTGATGFCFNFGTGFPSKKGVGSGGSWTLPLAAGTADVTDTAAGDVIYYTDDTCTTVDPSYTPEDQTEIIVYVDKAFGTASAQVDLQHSAGGAAEQMFNGSGTFDTSDPSNVCGYPRSVDLTGNYQSPGAFAAGSGTLTLLNPI